MSNDDAMSRRRGRRRGGGRGSGGPTLTTISWRDIPTQVMARPADGGEPARAELPPRFLVAVDAAAAAAGLEGTDDYLAQWVRRSRPCGPDIAAEVDAEVDRLRAAHPRDVLQSLVAKGGLHVVDDAEVAADDDADRRPADDRPGTPGHAATIATPDPIHTDPAGTP